ncbi:hypothetical protein [Microvirga sp. G4-2]|uniref:hypothetical protein n=1 Tax=Microvirga sp. G4-2 TaxID=3434467 RepID=UPI004043DE02
MKFLKLIFGTAQPSEDGIPKTEAIQDAEKQVLIESSQSHLESYLAYYTSCKDPRYAVLVTGDWGTGKTFQVRKALPDDKAYYVSLFGLNSTDDIVAAVYAAMFPGKARIKNIADSIGEMSAEVSGLGSLAVSGLTSGLVGAFLRQEVSTDKPIIFDDLERCGLGPKETLGIINLYVEHHGCRVIVIAHDEKLTEEFGETKEKIFGQTIRVEPQLEEAFSDFLSELSIDTQKEFIQKFKDVIIRLQIDSGVPSLRILRHVIQDLARLVGSLDERYRSHDQAMSELVQTFCALNIEWRARRLGPLDLRDRQKTEYAFHFAPNDGEQGKPKIVLSNERYKSIDLTSTILQDEVLYQVLVEGRYDKAAIEASLEASPYFLKPQISPPWQIVGSFDKLDDSVVTQGLARMQEQFDRREVSDSGEMLHIFALRMMMSSKGVLDKNIKETEQECKAYIDDLLRMQSLPPRELDYRWYDDFATSAYGIAYWVHDEYKAEFESVFNHLLDARNRSLELTFPKLASELLTILESDGQQFYEQVCYTRGGSNKYVMIPILNAIAPEDFVDAWMRSHKSNWYWIFGALRDRYEGGILERELKPEKDWIIRVLDLLEKEASKASGLARLRIQRSMPKIAFLKDDASRLG